MQTDTILAFQVEDGDTLLVGEITFLVRGEAADEGDELVFDLTDEDGEDCKLAFGPFETVEVVTSFDEDVEIEDVPIED